ncbi:TonB-dependent receptor [Sphingomonas sp. LB2R24]|uniref:TonB-dependent receptor domain-containing protein n=1 Tax=Sphingomonas sorbitolis TaxID=3096165 RepID=UPI002FC89AD7
MKKISTLATATCWAALMAVGSSATAHAQAASDTGGQAGGVPLTAQATTGAASSDSPPVAGQAQEPADQAANPAAGEKGAADIVVTGTRVTRDGYQAPTPTTVITADTFHQAAQATVVDYVNTLPALSGSSTPRNTGSVVGGGLGGANLLNLRNLGVNRTLVLLDGRRVVSAATIGAVDVNTLPTALLSRVDVVTGGASAAWGSDAVAGVVNFVLDTKYTGVKGEIESGISRYGDARRLRASLSGGTDFAGGRGHVIASAEYVNNGEAGRAGSRPWFQSWKVINNPGFVAGNGQPRRLLSPNVGLSSATDGGLITGGPLRGTQFLPGGVPAPFDFGRVAGNQKIGGTPNDVARNTSLLAPLEYGTAFVHANYDFSEAASLFVEGTYGKSVSDYPSVGYFRFNNITIAQGNPFLDSATRARLVGAGLPSFVMGRTNYDFGEPMAHNEREVVRGVIGLTGKSGSWSWDAYYQHGESRVLNLVRNDPVVARYNQAIDAVTGANGAIVCRSTLTNAADGCVPLNPFGVGSPSAGAINFITGTARQAITLKQDVAAATLRGEPFRLPAGPVSLATGVEYRREAFRATADTISLTDGFWLGNYKPAAGKYDVKEGFVELVVPIVKSEGILRSLDLNGAARVTHYNTSGTVVTWKGGATANIADSIRLRGTASRDIRAPNLNDLYLTGSVQSVLVNDTNGTSYFAIQRQTGNPSLRPEKAQTLSGGVVLSPQILPGFNVSVDYFHIRIKDAIATLTIQQIVDGCGAGTTQLCPYITRSSAGAITQVIATGLNLAQESTSGVDFEGSYRRRLSDLGIGSGDGTVTLRSLFTYVHDRVIALPGTRIDYAGEVANYSLPHWRGLASVNYTDRTSSLSVVGRYVGGGKINNAWVQGVDIDNNNVPSVWYFDTNVTLKLPPVNHREAEFFVSVENLFNTAPRISPNTTQVSNYGANSTVYDTLGRQFLAGFRFRL